MLVEGTLGRNNALRLADAKQASALRVSVISYFIFEPPCGSPRLAFATHSRSMSDCLDRPAQRPSPRPPLLPRRPREAGQLGRLGVPSPDKQTLQMVLQRRVQPVAAARPSLPSWPTCRPYAMMRRSRGRCTAAFLSLRRRIPGQLVQHHWCLVRRGPPSAPPSLRASRHGRCQTASITGGYLKSASYRSIRVRYWQRHGTSFFSVIGFDSASVSSASESN